MRVLIVGGSGGIGSALAAALAARPAVEQVVATWRTTPPERQRAGLDWVQLDPADEPQVAALAADTGPVDWLIVASGLLHAGERGPERTLKRFDPAFFEQNLRANTLPSLLLAKHFHPHQNTGRPSLFAALSARVGSIGDNRLGGWYSYRISKAALNMALVTLAVEWRRLVPLGCIASLHPGTVDTPLSRPFQRNVKPGKLFTSDHSARCLLQTLDRLTPADSGRFWSWDGSELPW